MTARVSNKFGYAAISIYASLIVVAVIVAFAFGDKILTGSPARPSADLLDIRTGSIRVYDERQRNCTQYSFDNVTGNYNRATAQPCGTSGAAPADRRGDISSFESIQRAFRGR